MHKHKHWLYAVAIAFPQKMEHVRDDWTKLSLGNHSCRNAHDIGRRVEYHATGCYQFDASPLRRGGGDVNTSRSFPHSWPIPEFVTRLTRCVSPVEQEPLSLLEHLGSAPVFSGVRVTRSLVLYACFVDRCFSFFGHCVVCSAIYGFWLPLWYLQTILTGHPYIADLYLSREILFSTARNVNAYIKDIFLERAYIIRSEPYEHAG